MATMVGVAKSTLDLANGKQLIGRILTDTRTDFILAPHYNAIYAFAGDKLWDMVSGILESGRYNPDLPITINAPKPRNFSRPGSVLFPIDRVVYQFLGDVTAPRLEESVDRTRSFSSKLLDPDPEFRMFIPAHTCWEAMRGKIAELCNGGGSILKLDISNYFERLPQHSLINLMRSSGCDASAINLLEEVLLCFQERNSFGIIQGPFTSDLLGNFFLSSVDSEMELMGVDSARYVDDIYIHFESPSSATRGLVRLIEHLRRNGLHVNESKSGVIPAEKLIKEETELDDLFEEARNQIENKFQNYEDLYGFAIGWEHDQQTGAEPPTEEERDVAAVIKLYSSIADNEKEADKIDKFCLPILAAAKSDFAVEKVLEGVVQRPHLTPVYLSYLTALIAGRDDIVRRLEQILATDEVVFDYQLMYLIGALMNADRVSRPTVNRVLSWLRNSQSHQATRAMAAIFTAKFGNPQQRNSVRQSYSSESSPYVRSAILYAARYFTSAERLTCRKAWGGHSAINSLIAEVLLKLPPSA